MNTIQSRIQHKRDTSSNWEQNNPIILAGEIIIVDTNSGERRTKTGDGIKRYNELPFDDELIRNLVSSKDAETLASAKTYTDDKVGDIDLSNMVVATGGGSIQPDGSIGSGPFVITMDEDEDITKEAVLYVDLTSTDGENFYGEIQGLTNTRNLIFVGVPNMTATTNVVRVYINNNNIGYVAIITLYADGTSGTVASGPKMLVKDKPVFLQTSPEYPGRLIASGFSQQTINDNSPTQGSKNFLSSGAVYTALQAKIATVPAATAGNVATFAEDGQIQDSGLSPEDFGKQDFVVTFSGNAPGPYSCDKTYAEISAAVESGKNVVGQYSDSSTGVSVNFNLYYAGQLNIGSNGAMFATVNPAAVGGSLGWVSMTILENGTIVGRVEYALGPNAIKITAATDYNTSRVRSISIQNTAPSTIPNGFLVGVYE